MLFGKLVSAGGFVLRKVRGQFAGCAQYGLAQSSGREILRTATMGEVTVAFVAALFVPLLVFGALFALMHAGPDHSGWLLAFPTAAATRKKGTEEEKKPANIRAMEADLKALAKELEEGQIEMSAGKITQERGEELEAKAMEMEELQDHIDRYNKIAGITKKARQVDKVTMPDDTDRNRKSIITTPGHLFVLSEGFAEFKKGNPMSGWSNKVEVGKRFGKKTRLYGEAAIAFEKKAFDPSQLSDLGEDALVQVDRDPEIVRFEEPEILTMRDVLNVVPTSSDAIRYVKHVATSRAAESQATRGGQKKYLTVTLEATDTAVRTLAVLSKVTEQDIDDAPRLVGLINGEMTLDVRVEEERQLTWGDGSNGTLFGLFDPSIGVPEFDRAEIGDTVIDTIRKIRTDLRKTRVQPNFVMIDPIDWEEVELTKGSDTHYIWGLITDLRGPRIWSLRVIESDAMTNLETNERRILVGDGVRGATIYDRNSIQLAVGFVNDDFERNLRTLRAEERLAFAVKRAFAFEYATTAEAES